MSRPPDRPADAWGWYLSARRRYCRLLVITLALWLGFGILAVEGVLTGWKLLPLFLAFIVAAFLTAARGAHLWSWRCPACGQRFNSLLWQWPGLHCVHCGIEVGTPVVRMGSAPSVGPSTPRG